MFVPIYFFSEAQNQTIAVSHDNLALPVKPILRAINNFGAARAQVIREGINPC